LRLLLRGLVSAPATAALWHLRWLTAFALVLLALLIASSRRLLL
jgi:hypothetical protein